MLLYYTYYHIFEKIRQMKNLDMSIMSTVLFLEKILVKFFFDMNCTVFLDLGIWVAIY